MLANLDRREAEKSYGITGDDLTLSMSWSLYSLRKDWNQAKVTVAPWWGECSKEAFNTAANPSTHSFSHCAMPGLCAYTSGAKVCTPNPRGQVQGRLLFST